MNNRLSATLHLGAIILAAGEAKRFGSPKQLLVYKSKTLVARAVEACLAAGAQQVVVVTGAHRQELENALQAHFSDPRVTLSHNERWAEGMHTSITCGMHALMTRQQNLQSVLITLVDQPLVDASFLRKLVEEQQGADAAALSYPSGAGVPACFDVVHFQKLLNLTTSGGGAKGILRDPRLNIRLLDAPERRLDIDTFEDWNDFTRGQS
jgi:molybdenum cofactor cytidylyltransferase